MRLKMIDTAELRQPLSFLSDPGRDFSTTASQLYVFCDAMSMPNTEQLSMMTK